jgi:hypothetical protein
MKGPIAGILGTAFALTLTLTGGTAVAQGVADGHIGKKPAREMTTKLHQHPLQLRVRVHGDYSRAPTFLQKKTCATCTWHIIDRKKTDTDGRVLYPLDAPATGSWFYRVGTPERPAYRESYSRVARTFQQ